VKVCEEKQETSVHAMTTSGFYIYGLAHLRYKIVESIIAMLHGLIKLK